jgi:phosphoribosyl 1,2-cyclic phosphate phosphodiesterase
MSWRSFTATDHMIGMGARVLAGKFATTEFPGELIMLGTGTSTGVPAIGCQCDVCTSDDSHNNRTRCSIILGAPGGNLLVDTPPDLRFQLLRENIGVVHSVLFTHEHADHIFGLDDLRLFQFYLGHPVPLLCEENVEQRIRTSFDYANACGVDPAACFSANQYRSI